MLWSSGASRPCCVATGPVSTTEAPNTHINKNICVYIYTHIYIYIYMKRERERGRYTDIFLQREGGPQ